MKPPGIPSGEGMPGPGVEEGTKKEIQVTPPPAEIPPAAHIKVEPAPSPEAQTGAPPLKVEESITPQKEAKTPETLKAEVVQAYDENPSAKTEQMARLADQIADPTDPEIENLSS